LSEGYAPMRIMVNGVERQGQDATIADLMASLQTPLKGVAVERNRLIVPKSLYKTTYLEEGDEIEIVDIVGGG
jgi:thiamine biosynthesis protein ThiS